MTTPRERVLNAIDRRPTDRPATDIWAVPEVEAALREHLGLNKPWAVRDALGIDGIASIGPRYVGPALPDPGDGITIDPWGVRYRKVDFGSGTYDEAIDRPLATVTDPRELDDYAWPAADWWDVGAMEAECDAHRDRAIATHGSEPFLRYCHLRGQEQALTDLVLEPGIAETILDRVSSLDAELLERKLTACAGRIDLVYVAEDLGTQNGLLMSPATWRTFLRPAFARMIDQAHRHGTRVFHHDDGAVRELLPDLVEAGIDVLNPLQWRCRGMDRGELKQTFGGQIAFHGGVDNQDTLFFGTPDDVRREVRDNLRLLAPDRTGYVVAPCHNLQAGTPVDNILAMYEAAAGWDG